MVALKLDGLEERRVKIVKDYVRVRRMYEIEGLSLREISRQTGFHRKTIKKMITEGTPPGYERRRPPSRPVLGPFVAIIDEIVKSDKGAPPEAASHGAQDLGALKGGTWLPGRLHPGLRLRAPVVGTGPRSLRAAGLRAGHGTGGLGRGLGP